MRSDMETAAWRADTDDRLMRSNVRRCLDVQPRRASRQCWHINSFGALVHGCDLPEADEAVRRNVFIKL